MSNQKVSSFSFGNLPEIEYEGIRISKTSIFGIKDMIEVFDIEVIKQNLMDMFENHLERTKYDVYPEHWESFRMLYSFLDGIERDNRRYLIKKKENSKE